jgi:CRISPR system Cascade subunit CasE
VPLHLIQVTFDLVAAARQASASGLSRPALRDPGLVLKTALTEAFSGPIVRPWMLHAQRARQAVVLGYSRIAVSEIESRLALAIPSAREAVLALRGHALPPLLARARLRFHGHICPTINVTVGRGRRHGERDAFLVAADVVGADGGLDREKVYAQYLAEHLRGATIETCRMTGFRLHKMIRKAESSGTGFATRTVPLAILDGTLVVTAPTALADTLAAGVGRQRAFGCGMIRLEPSPLTPAT